MTMMAHAYLKQFSTAVEKSKGTRTQKLLRSPLKIACSKILQLISERLNTLIQVKAKTFWGDKMSVVFPNEVAILVFRYGFFEEGLTRIVLEYLKPGMVLFDIGAHFGYFTLLGSRIVGGNGQVHSFEPTPGTFQVLQANSKSTGNVKVNNLAAWSTEASLSFNDYGPKFSGFNSVYSPRMDDSAKKHLQIRTYQVQAVPVDQYVAKTGAAPSFVKIDAESAEFEILRGMERTLMEFRPIISLEVGDMNVEGAVLSRDLVPHLLAKGYRAFEFNNGKIVEHRLRGQYAYDNIVFLPNAGTMDSGATGDPG